MLNPKCIELTNNVDEHVCLARAFCVECLDTVSAGLSWLDFVNTQRTVSVDLRSSAVYILHVV